MLSLCTKNVHQHAGHVTKFCDRIWVSLVKQWADFSGMKLYSIKILGKNVVTKANSRSYGSG